MLQPTRLALALVLVWGAAPRADAAPLHTKRERPVAVVVNPDAPLPEVRVEKATPTRLLFPMGIAKSTLTVDGVLRTVDKSNVLLNNSAKVHSRSPLLHPLLLATASSPVRASSAPVGGATARVAPVRSAPRHPYTYPPP